MAAAGPLAAPEARGRRGGGASFAGGPIRAADAAARGEGLRAVHAGAGAFRLG